MPWKRWPVSKSPLITAVPSRRPLRDHGSFGALSPSSGNARNDDPALRPQPKVRICVGCGATNNVSIRSMAPRQTFHC